MRNRILIIAFILASPKFSYNQKITYYIMNKGVYIEYEKKNGRLKLPYKENEDFYFSLKNDTVAIIQNLKRRKLFKEVEMDVSKEFYIGYKKNIFISNKKKRNVYEKFKYKKVGAG